MQPCDAAAGRGLSSLDRRASRLVVALLAAGCLLTVALSAGLGLGGGAAVAGGLRARVAGAYGRLPLSFEPNVGQAAGGVRFLARGAGSTLLLSSRGAVLALDGRGRSRGRALRLEFPGAGDPVLSGAGVLPGKVNYLVGSDRSRWRVGVSTYRRVRFRDLWPGIEASFDGTGSRIEYDLRLAAGADPRRIALRFGGVVGERIDAAGALVLSLAGGGQVRELAPVAYQWVAGHRRPVASRFVLDGPLARIALGGYDHRLALTIDPSLVYSTYLGGSGFEQGSGIAVNSAGEAYIAGTTSSTNFATTEGALQRSYAGPNADVFVSKLNAAGSALVYSTYLGGSNSDFATGVAIDGAGDAYVTGGTFSANFPTTPGAAQRVKAGKGETTDDVFVSELNPSGSALVYSTYLGGSNADEARGIAVDLAGDAFITGITKSTNFPTSAGALDANYKAIEATAFVSKLSTSGALEYSTYLGGSEWDEGHAIAVDAAGEAFVTGETSSEDFPLKDPLQSGVDGAPKVFVTKLDAAGSGLVYSTLLGGSVADSGEGIALDAAGDAYVAGVTDSQNYPTQNAEQPLSGGGTGDAFVTKINAAGSALDYSTYLGGSGQDIAFAIAVDQEGSAYVAGYTTSQNFPTLDAAQAACGDPGCSQGDAFITKLTSAGALAYSSYLGGSGKEQAYGVAVDPAGGAYLTGFTSSATDFPEVNPLQPTYGGSTADAFVAKLAGPDTVAPTSAAALPLCRGPVTVLVTDNPGGSGAAGVRFRLDGGPEQELATSGNPGVASIPIPEGNHTLEYWGEDVAGNQESPHHVASVQIDTTSPIVSITSDQGFSSYEIGDHATVSVSAHDATSGLVADPSRSHASIPTTQAGSFTVGASATDRCGNSAQASFQYTVIPDPDLSREVDLETRSGHVSVRAAGAHASASSQGGFTALEGARQLAVGSVIEATAGEVAVTAATTAHGHLQTAVLAGGRFEVLQPHGQHGLVTLRLIDAASRRSCSRHRTGGSSGRKSPSLGLLRASASGSFRLSGADASATTRGRSDSWDVEDRCDGTLTAVTHGSVTVATARAHAKKVLTASHEYLART